VRPGDRDGRGQGATQGSMAEIAATMR
jgi:hypothetical protein